MHKGNRGHQGTLPLGLQADLPRSICRPRVGSEAASTGWSGRSKDSGLGAWCPCLCSGARAVRPSQTGVHSAVLGHAHPSGSAPPWRGPDGDTRGPVQEDFPSLVPTLAQPRAKVISPFNRKEKLRHRETKKMGVALALGHRPQSALRPPGFAPRSAPPGSARLVSTWSLF